MVVVSDSAAPRSIRGELGRPRKFPLALFPLHPHTPPRKHLQIHPPTNSPSHVLRSPRPARRQSCSGSRLPSSHDSAAAVRPIDARSVLFGVSKSHHRRCPCGFDSGRFGHGGEATAIDPRAATHHRCRGHRPDVAVSSRELVVERHSSCYLSETSSPLSISTAG